MRVWMKPFWISCLLVSSGLVTTAFAQKFYRLVNPLGGSPGAIAYNVNNRGEVAAAYLTGSSSWQQRPLRWIPLADIVDELQLTGRTQGVGVPRRIASTGNFVAVNEYQPSSFDGGYLWRPSGLTNLVGSNEFILDVVNDYYLVNVFIDIRDPGRDVIRVRSVPTNAVMVSINPPRDYSRIASYRAGGGIEDNLQLTIAASFAADVSNGPTVRAFIGSVDFEIYPPQFRGWLPLPALGDQNIVRQIAQNGSIAVGEALDGRWWAVYWTLTASPQVIRLPDADEALRPRGSFAYDVSADGRYIVGAQDDREDGIFAVLWTRRGNSYVAESLTAKYRSIIPRGIFLRRAYGISPDGRFIVGESYNIGTNRSEGFLIDTKCVLSPDINGDGVVDDADLLQVLLNFGRSCER